MKDYELTFEPVELELVMETPIWDEGEEFEDLWVTGDRRGAKVPRKAGGSGIQNTEEGLVRRCWRDTF